MPPKAPIATTLKAITLQNKNTNIIKSEKSLDLQVVTMQDLREIVNYINNNI